MIAPDVRRRLDQRRGMVRYVAGEVMLFLAICSVILLGWFIAGMR